MRPTLRQLEYLVELAQCLSFRGAAERCSVTQPALSKQVQQLEAIVGVKLFERDSKRVLPTPAGRELARQARRVLREVDLLVETGRGLGPPLAGTLRLGVIPTIAPYVLPAVLPAIRAAFHDLRLLLREGKTADLVRNMQDGELDVLLLASDEALDAAEHERLFSEEFLLAAPKDHPLAGAGRLTMDDLRGHEILLLEEGHCMRAQVIPLCQRAGLQEIGDFRASSLATLVEMVANGIGVTLLPEMAVAAVTRDHRSVVVREIECAPTREIGLTWRPGCPRADEFRMLGHVMREAWARSD